jgi:uncharacterized coiled-coil protein SlyX
MPLNQNDKKFIQGLFSATNQRIDKLEFAVADNGKRIGELTDRVTSNGKRIDTLENRIGSLEKQIKAVDQKIDIAATVITERIDQLETGMINSITKEVLPRLDGHEDRLQNLEKHPVAS